MSNYEEILQLQEDYLDKAAKRELHGAILNKDLDKTRSLIALNVNLDSKDDQGRTCLHVAILMENVEVVNLLLERGVDINCSDDDGNTALYYAVVQSNRDLAILLMENGAIANVKNHEDCSPLMKAVLADQPTILFTLLEFGADANCGSYLDKPPLWAAIMLGMQEIVYLLLQGHANVNEKLTFKDNVEMLLIEYSDLSEHRTNISDILLANLMKRRSLGEEISPENLKYMSVKLGHMNTTYKQEISEMKKTKFRKDLTVYDFLTKDRYELNTYVTRNKLDNLDKHILKIESKLPYLINTLLFRIKEIGFCSKVE